MPHPIVNLAAVEETASFEGKYGAYSGKILVRGLAGRGQSAVGRFERTDYMDGEPAAPRIFELARQRP